MQPPSLPPRAPGTPPPPPMNSGPIYVASGMDMQALADVYARVWTAAYVKSDGHIAGCEKLAERAVRHFRSIMVSER